MNLSQPVMWYQDDSISCNVVHHLTLIVDHHLLDRPSLHFLRYLTSSVFAAKKKKSQDSSWESELAQ
jgi:hypothetical protein